MIYVPTEVKPVSVFARLYKPLYMKPMHANSELQRYMADRAPGQSSTSGTECHTVLVGSRFQLQETVSAGTGSYGVS